MSSRKNASTSEGPSAVQGNGHSNHQPSTEGEDGLESSNGLAKSEGTPSEESWGAIQWNYVVFYTVIHLFGLYGLYLTVSGLSKWQTVLSAYLETVLATFGILAGAHRLWSHRAYKATLPLR